MGCPHNTAQSRSVYFCNWLANIQGRAVPDDVIHAVIREIPQDNRVKELSLTDIKKYLKIAYNRTVANEH